jgi:hypothetical protein
VHYLDVGDGVVGPEPVQRPRIVTARAACEAQGIGKVRVQGVGMEINVCEWSIARLRLTAGPHLSTVARAPPVLPPSASSSSSESVSEPSSSKSEPYSSSSASLKFDGRDTSGEALGENCCAQKDKTYPSSSSSPPAAAPRPSFSRGWPSSPRLLASSLYPPPAPAPAPAPPPNTPPPVRGRDPTAPANPNPTASAPVPVPVPGAGGSALGPLLTARSSSARRRLLTAWELSNRGLYLEGAVGGYSEGDRG